ncbi:OmpW family outer membrane protein [Noviherbaspirillum sp.]|jgi:outer membrane protein|uniref:OmpW/AlkL family protein n=1 Tax=Noviherbaspirillum sp. TaxID=1926288 RepID=UPI0025D2123B|nr:OmpW family outer membrane protein [Noviherbaspirillum sp.]HJV81164.1 OmpW family outer membrane protein [Noviherbaspirillum sp.]
MKKSAVILALAALGLASHAFAQQSPWQIRARAVQIDPADKSDAGGPLALPADAITVSNKTIPEVDISYFFSPNIAAELILTYPQKHDVFLSGTKIGTFKHLPPTLTLQYHFMPAAQVSPYLGAGVNYTNISSVSLLNGAGSLDHHSFGLALQAGVDFKIDKNWSLNLDVKKVQIRSDVMVSGAKVSAVKVDPLLIGLGVGYRF